MANKNIRKHKQIVLGMPIVECSLLGSCNVFWR